jgi:hypothetical protein
MNRRTAIKNLLLLSTGAALIPLHLRSQNGPSISLDQFAATASQENLLAEIVDTLIPATDTPGAKALNLHLFVLMMLNDCHSATDQHNFMAGLDQVDAFAIEHTTKPFTACAPSERIDLLVNMKSKQQTPPELWHFNRLMRSRTIEGYRESEYVMTHILPHQMIPPPYDGYYPASNYQLQETLPHG